MGILKQTFIGHKVGRFYPYSEPKSLYALFSISFLRVFSEIMHNDGTLSVNRKGNT